MDNSTQRILIIDDDDDCRKLLINWLNGQFVGIQIEEYDPVQQGAPDRNFKWADYDVLLLDYDLRLETVTGLDILQDNYDNLLFPVTIMLTGAGNEDVAVRAVRSGVSDYLRKEYLKKSTFREALENAFAEQSEKRQRLYTLDDALHLAQTESKRIIDEYKAKYDRDHSHEMEKLKEEIKNIQEELNNNNAKLASLEETEKNAAVEKSKLLIEMHELDSEDTTIKDKEKIKKDMNTTQSELLQVNEKIKNIKQNIKVAEAAIEKVRWKEEKESTEKKNVERDLDVVLGNLRKTSNEKAEMSKRLDMFFNRNSEPVNSDKENQKLFDEITTQLKSS